MLPVSRLVCRSISCFSSFGCRGQGCACEDAHWRVRFSIACGCFEYTKNKQAPTRRTPSAPSELVHVLDSRTCQCCSRAAHLPCRAQPSASDLSSCSGTGAWCGSRCPGVKPATPTAGAVSVALHSVHEQAMACSECHGTKTCQGSALYLLQIPLCARLQPIAALRLSSPVLRHSSVCPNVPSALQAHPCDLNITDT